MVKVKLTRFRSTGVASILVGKKPLSSKAVKPASLYVGGVYGRDGRGGRDRAEGGAAEASADAGESDGDEAGDDAGNDDAAPDRKSVV